MNKIIIKNWFGRLNNNLIQLLNCIRLCYEKNYSTIEFPNHPYFIGNSITINNKNNEDKQDLIDNKYDNFYFYFINQNIENNFQQWKEHFHKHIKNILKFNLNKSLQIDETVIYIRGNDMLWHGGLPQPPLSFYKKILEKHNNIRLICEDLTNPCAKYLIDNKMVKWQKQSLEDDIFYMVHAKTLAIAHGTFCFLPLLLNSNLENLWISDYVSKVLKEHWKIDYKSLTDSNIVMIDTNPEYLKSFQVSKMLLY